MPIKKNALDLKLSEVVPIYRVSKKTNNLKTTDFKRKRL
jgi:hypothetical protein|tara:strand:+ start:959 stop:1075 length:117 start_codon:yes stop_codon:yes gene_type:complete